MLTFNTMSDYYSLSLPTSATVTHEPSPLLVLPNSPTSMRKHVEKFAAHFKREMHFDSLQFASSESPDQPWFVRYEAYLFHEMASDLLDEDKPTRHRFFGACCFRWRESDDAPPNWSLDWIWFHPYFRGRGHLQKAWLYFERRYGEFHVAPPLSARMKEIVHRAGRMKQDRPV